MVKKNEEVLATESVEAAAVSLSRAKIAPVTTDFGREDLNLLRDTVNELVKRS